jgi:glycosyltransferase involved in cell wall biosynthesis
MSKHSTGGKRTMTSEKWLILTQYYPPEVGAPQVRLPCLAGELARNGREVRVLTAMPNYPTNRVFEGYRGRFFSRENIKGVPVDRTWIYAAHGRSVAKRLANYGSFTISSLLRIVTLQKPDVLFIDGQPLLLGLHGLILKTLRNVPYIYHVPDLQIDVAEQLGFIRGRNLRFARGLEDVFLHHAWRVSVPTRSFIDAISLRDVPVERITFLPSGVDIEHFRPLPPNNALRRRLGLEDRKVFVYAGTHAHYQGIDVILKAAALLRAHPDVAFVIAGDGPERARLIRLASELQLTSVSFPGQWSYEELPSLYSIACCSLATIRALPVAKKMRLAKLLPALACGVPVLHSGEGEGADIIAKNQCGIVLPSEDPVALANAILGMANDDNKQRSLSRRARQLAEREFGWGPIVTRWLTDIHFPPSREEPS